jgi:hypothetical protein
VLQKIGQQFTLEVVETHLLIAPFKKIRHIAITDRDMSIFKKGLLLAAESVGSMCIAYGTGVHTEKRRPRRAAASVRICSK